MSLQPHQQRVVAEQAELAQRIVKLAAFIGGEHWDKVARGEQDRLRRQLTAMEQYDAVLLERLEAFSRSTP